MEIYMKSRLNEKALSIVETLKGHGFEAVYAGGCVHVVY
jgi:tRNA nucleotidyltransferase/poly(A) polymerase